MADRRDIPASVQRTPIEERGQRFVDALRRAEAPDQSPPNAISRAMPDPRIGVALGGGSARGMTHIPYIEAMDELGLSPHVISGTSIGALIGSGWASGMTGRDLREFSLSVMGTMKVFMGRIWATQVRGLGGILQSGLSVQLDALRMVDAFTPPTHPRDFKDLRIPFYVVATDFQSWHQVVFNSGPLREAIAGSIAIPTLFKPVVHANHVLVDGGVVNPLPLDQAAAGSDILVGIDVNGDPSTGLKRTDFKALDVWFGSAQIMMHSLIAHMMAAYPPDIYMRPAVSAFGAMEFWRVKEILTNGEKDKERFKRALASKIETFILSQQKTASEAPPSVLRLARK